LSIGAFPTELVANAWDGEGTVRGAVDARSATRWALGAAPAGLWMRPGAAPDERDHADPRIGWGIVLPDDDDVPLDARARADDAPEPIRELVNARPGAKVLRWRKALGPMAVAEYDGGAAVPIPLAAAEAGTGPGRLPRYLLLYGGPDVLPWWLQYTLNAGNYVGRLHLEGQALENYVAALMSDWSSSAVRYDRPVVWAPDFGGTDMTAVMRRTLAVPVAETLRRDREMGGLAVLEGEAATAGGLCEALAGSTPALIVTTSHGQTGPLADPAAMRRSLGALVAQDRAAIDPADLLATWEPDGAIWYAHACCSAGADAPSSFAELFEPGSGLRALLEQVAGVGPDVAPLPSALLGRERPLRAFIGHVEPTFDWTIRFPWDDQPMTSSIAATLYQGLCLGEPVGYAARRVWSPIGQLATALENARKLVNAGRSRRQEGLSSSLYLQIVWRDRASTVILGDPVAAMRLPNGGP
jgi:hypothetical protein